MECRKLYYEDPMLRSFTATVTGCIQTAKGYEVTLDATAFYPEGGGQACDTGTLGAVRVLDVQEKDETILHLCDAPLPVGQTVEGSIDWALRFDRMQQHTGEHILSGLIHARFGWHNVGFHMGNGLMEVDFDGPITAEEAARLEAEVNAIVWEDRPIKCWYPSEAELPSVPYRSKRALPWPVRIVQVPGADSCACCGTHVTTTGQVGLVKILSVTKFHAGVRIEMACGKRALDYLSAVTEQNRQVSQCFSAKPLETAEAARKISAALAAEKLRANTLQTRIFDQISQNYVNQKDVLHFEPGLDGGGVRTLAEKISNHCNGFCAVFSPKEDGFSYCLACKEGDLRSLCKEMNATLNGRGGGKPQFQQGTVQAAETAIRSFFENR